MKTWYVNERSNMFIDFDNNATKTIDCEYTSINDCYIAPCDCKMYFTNKKGEVTECDVKKGQLVITFYSENMPNRFIVLDEPKLIENIIAHKEYREKAEVKACGDNCCGTCSPSC